MTYFNTAITTCPLTPIPTVTESSFADPDTLGLVKDLAGLAFIIITVCLCLKPRSPLSARQIKPHHPRQTVDANVSQASATQIAAHSKLISCKTTLNSEEVMVAKVLVNLIKDQMDKGQYKGFIGHKNHLRISYTKINKYLNENYSNLIISYNSNVGFKWITLPK